MKIKVSKHKLNIHYRGSPRGSRTQQHAYCLRYEHSQHIESHLGKKQPQAKIPIAFLFSQLHFNNVTSHALFFFFFLVMPSKRCAVHYPGITLIVPPKSCDRVKPVFLAGAWSSYVNATLADNGYTGDLQKSSKDCY